MTIGALGPSDFGISTAITQKSATHFLIFNAKGLKPSTSFSLFVDGVDSTWAAKQFGQDMGVLLSTSLGRISFGLLHELPYSGSYSFDIVNINTSSKQSAGGQKTINNYQRTSKLLELKGGGTTSQFFMPVRILTVPGDSTQQSQHGH